MTKRKIPTAGTNKRTARNVSSSIDYGALTAAALNEHFSRSESENEEKRKAYLLGLRSRTESEQSELDAILAKEGKALGNR